MTHLGWFSLEFSVCLLQSVLIFSNLATVFSTLFHEWFFSGFDSRVILHRKKRYLVPC